MLEDDERWMAEAIALATEVRGRTGSNPNVGCVIVKAGRVIGRGATQPGGRPHAEAVALAQAGVEARGATIYTSLEPCAHESERGPACALSLIDAGVARACVGVQDPDARTNGRGIAAMRAAGISVSVGTGRGEAVRAMSDA